MGNKHTNNRNAQRHRAAGRTGRVRASESIRKRIKLFNQERDPDTNRGRGPEQQKDPFRGKDPFKK